ncbi:MAG: hypothetical protein JWL97_4507 [Gemmatimonadales bacterium]|jgi:hypothetical protein|nr:hypothetical protein [Gemmatimonadales bacterium]
MSRWIDAFLNWLADRDARRRPTLTTSFAARLGSSLPEAYFRAVIDLTWPPLREDLPPGLRACAEQQLRGTIQQTAQQHSVLHLGEAESAINLALHKDRQLTDADVRLIAAEAILTAEPAGLELAEQHEVLQRESVLAHAGQQANLDRLRHLGDQILTDPALARLWWMDGNRDRLPKLVEMDGMFEKAAALITTQPEPARTDPIAELIHIFLRDLGPEHRELLIKQIKHVFIAYERPELAQQVDVTHRPPVSPWPNHQGPSAHGHNGSSA